MKTGKANVAFFSKDNILFFAIILNFLYLFGMLLFFEPFLSITDYNMAETCYGVYDGYYNYHTLFEHFWYGRIVVFFLKWIPAIPWYTVLFYIWVFIALTFMTYILLSWRNDTLGLVIVNILLLFFSYEAYIFIHFTKVAGIIGGVGFFALFAYKSGWKSKVISVILMLLSALIRYNMMEMLVGVWFLAFVAKTILNIVNGKRHMEWRDVRRYLFSIGMGIAMLVVVFYFPKYTSEAEEAQWKNIFNWISIRSTVQDYIVPDYDENMEEYKKIDVTENDLDIWHAWNSDAKTLTLEKGKAIKALQPRSEGLIAKAVNVKNITSFFKVFPNKFLSIDVYIAFLALFVIVTLYCKEQNLKSHYLATLFTVFILLSVNYYLFINGRYLQHRVDVGVIFNACLIYLFFIMDFEKVHSIEKESLTYKRIVGVIVCFLLFVPYQYYSDDVNYVGNDTLTMNRRFFESTHEDEKHYYLIGNDRNSASVKQICYGAFDRFPLGIKENVFMGCPPESEERLKDKGIDNPFVDIIDNEDMYLVLDKNNADTAKWKKYFEDRIGKKVKVTLVKSYFNNNIYKVHTKSLEKTINPEQASESDEVIENLESVVKKGKISLKGSVYLKTTTGFSQNVYMQVVDNETGKSSLYSMVQKCDGSKIYGDEGYFSKIDTKIKLPKSYNEGDVINIVIENNGKFYTKRIR